MSSPILHGTALCPLLRFPRGGRTQIRVVMDEDLDLTDDIADILFGVRARYGADRTPIRITRAGTGAAWTASAPNTTTLALAPDAADETEDSERVLGDLHEEGAGAWRMDFLDADGIPVARIQGDIEWLPEDGDWNDDPASETTLPSLTVSLVNGAVTVTVSLIGDGATVDNASVVTAIEEDPAAARTALGLATTDNVSFSRVQATEAGGWGTAVLRPSENNIGFSGLETWGIAVIFNGTTWAWYDVRGGVNPTYSVVGNVAASKYRLGSYGGDVFLSESSSGVAEINNGTTGQYRDLILRDLLAAQYLRPASFTVAVANALSSPPDGAIIHVSNEAGGACNAYRARSAWRRIYDDAAIS